MSEPARNLDSMLENARSLEAGGKTALAEGVYLDILRFDPQHSMALNGLSALYAAGGNVTQAVTYCRRAAELSPRSRDVRYNLGVLLQKSGDLSAAQVEFEQARNLDPSFAPAYLGLGVLMCDARNYDMALEYFAAARKINETAQVCIHMAHTYKMMGRADDAGAFYARALECDPLNVQACNDLGSLYMKVFKFEEALDLFERALISAPNDARVLGNIASIYNMAGQSESALATYQRAIALMPYNPVFYNNLMLAMVYAPGVTPAQITQTAQEFGAKLANYQRRSRKLSVDRNPDRRLRIGYVSGDFRKHSVSYFIKPLLAAHDRAGFELFAYANQVRGDDVTEGLKPLFDVWRDIDGIGDDAVADMVEADRIDILIDLSGHTDGNRLMMFARKPAPVQITWLGFPATTGMSAMDYRITDIHAEPPGQGDDLSVEKLWRLPHIFCCYSGAGRPVEMSAVPPHAENGFITFGCFNNFGKVTDEALRAWAEILRRVPGSKLMLEVAGLESPRLQANIRSRLQGAEMPQQSVSVIRRRPENQFVLYNRIDIALDPFPCNGGTTSMDTLWMGVPLVTLAGGHFVSRMGVTILTNAGQGDLIARNIDEYIEKAVKLAGDHARLKDMRMNLRAKLEASPVMDARAFARDMEDAYRGMWRAFCVSDTE
jgi:predicted O-linked N-acetylglucosamine transferase (SPINDLY family)